jgi:hypothetical protein
MLPLDYDMGCYIHTSGASIHHHHHRKALLLQHRPPARHPLFHCLGSGPMFTSQFSHELFQLTGVKLQFSSAFHPQSDGKSEAPNKVITMLLHCLSVRSPLRLVALASLDGVLLQLQIPIVAQDLVVQICVWERSTLSALIHIGGSTSARHPPAGFGT